MAINLQMKFDTILDIYCEETCFVILFNPSEIRFTIKINTHGSGNKGKS